MTAWRRSLLAVLSVVGGLLVTAAASADDYSYSLTAADQAAARAVVIHRADLGTATQWKGGLVTPDRSQLQCPHYNPKQSDLVVTGNAEAHWAAGNSISFESSVKIFESEWMVRTDWARSYTSALLPCLRATAAHGIFKGARLVSVQRIRFPPVSTFTEAIRTLVDVSASGKTVRVMVDAVLIGHGRTEIALVTTAAYAARAPVTAAEDRLAVLLASRAPAF
jgi:hypothetical protein